MNGNGRFGWVFVLAAALFAVAIAIIAYNIGVSDGAVAGTAPAAAVQRVQWGWHGGGLVWLLFFALFWGVLFRGGCWRRHYWYGPSGPYWGPPRPPADEMDDWHRRAHERMKENGTADDPGRRG